jgi:hypothetical protein
MPGIEYDEVAASIRAALRKQRWRTAVREQPDGSVTVSAAKGYIKESGNPDAGDLPIGLGVTNVKGVLRELRRQKFDGNISIEYERDWENTVPDIAQCVGYVRGFADAEEKP